jgi:cell division protease FtsH
MATSSEPLVGLPSGREADELARGWRRLTRAATFVAVLTSPVAFLWFHDEAEMGLWWSLLLTFLSVIAFRGVVDIVLRRFVPWPTLFGSDDARVQEEDVIARRRAWYWRKKIRLAVWIAAAWLVLWLAGVDLGEVFTFIFASGLWIYLIIFPLLFLGNFLILFGPLVFMGISQMRAYEPGDADWGVKLEDVRGQAEAKEEVRRVVSLWQSGEAFEEAGGKRERGLLLLGAPGTGKTMLSKGIATNFNAPFLSMPGSGFAQTFIGMDVVIVRYMAWKAKRLARKWGGQCIVFIDEIDAVGRRRAALEGGSTSAQPTSIHDLCFYGPWGALNPSGDLIVETRRWRERLFELREEVPALRFGRVGALVNQVMPGMFGGMGQLALNQLLVVMDGISDPPFWRRFWTNRINTFLDATYLVPTRAGRLSLRLPRPRPRAEQIFFIGATNVPIDVLDPALIRPGRMGRHVWFRTPTKDDRKDIFDLYLGKVAHERELDASTRRDEIARITNGYSPAMIEQVCSMALTLAHHEGRRAFGREDLFEAMTTVESGTAIDIEYVPEETRAVAIHEAGHAAAAHVYLKGFESSRLSIRMRGRSLGHHQAFEREERFSKWRSEEMGALIHALGAMAAERVFYGENSNGVGGDVQHATIRAALMVGAAAMGPEPAPLNGDGRMRRKATEQEERERIMRRFETIGMQIMNRTGGGGPFHHDPIVNVLSDREKRALAAQLLGQAYVTAHTLVAANKEAVESIAEAVVERREIYGDDLIQLLERSNLAVPETDLREEASWPRL